MPANSRASIRARFTTLAIPVAIAACLVLLGSVAVPAANAARARDDTPPTITQGPTTFIIPTSTVTATGVPVDVIWNAVPGDSDIASYTLERKVDNGPFVTQLLEDPTDTHNEDSLLPGHLYQYRVSATDTAGSAGEPATGKPFKVNLVQENGRSVTYSAGWTRQALADSSGGFVKFATTKGKIAKFTFTGTQVAWVTTAATNHGAANVSVDGRPPVKIDTSVLAAAPVAAPVMSIPATVEFARMTRRARHTITITDLATPKRPRVDVDAFVFFS